MPRKPAPRATAPPASQKGLAKVIGYARVSTDDQTAALQIDALRAAGVSDDCLHVDEGWSGSMSSRPALDAALAAVASGDTLIVWKLDRLGRSLAHLVDVADGLRERGVRFRSLTEAIDTETASGRLLYSVLGAVAQFERDVMIERTRAGMKAAKARGTHVGRPVRLGGSRLAEARKMIAEGRPVREVAHLFGVDPSTVYRAVAEIGLDKLGDAIAAADAPILDALGRA